MALVGSNSFFLRIDDPLELFNSLSINLDKSSHSIHTYIERSSNYTHYMQAKYLALALKMSWNVTK